ncbi:hypothetical protein C8N43_2349 [Litoreibacter ponti]|uniref:Uncharacterized protein n=1 Tax=Litoreibacter ponti TaxID=1510457 RepID=A0A2T6BNM2_9RHOB|nr:hypothetical protein [Litoreibacter ponti]PTX57678.1 hypothetical protein C8N43_2349 [Litoreibacter ponti]
MNVGEGIKASSMKHWSLTGPSRLVKVFSISARNFMGSEKNSNKDHISGYVTEERYLWGLTATEIEMKLGLRPFELRPLVYVYALARLPSSDEVEFKFSAGFPDGKPVGQGADKDAFHKDMMQARKDYADGKNTHGPQARSMTPVVQLYGPGSFKIPQWKLIAPVPVGRQIATVSPTIAFPRPNGSVKPYTPHNRGGV